MCVRKNQAKVIFAVYLFFSFVCIILRTFRLFVSFNLYDSFFTALWLLKTLIEAFAFVLCLRACDIKRGREEASYARRRRLSYR